MTAPFSVRKRAEEFAVAVDGTPDVASLRPELRELVGVAGHLREQGRELPRPEFSMALREQLLAEAETVLTPGNASLALPVRTRGVRERRLVAAAAAVVLVGGTAGMAAAAQDALPGEALYPLKRGIEQAQAGLSVTPAGKGRDLLGQADDRLGEIEGLLARRDLGDAPQVPPTVAVFAEQASEGSGLLMDSYLQTQDPEAIVEVRTFAAEAIASLGQIAESAPAQAQNDLASAANTLSEIDARAAELCASCAGDLPPLEIPGLLLASADANRVLNDIDWASLNNSHPVTVPRGWTQTKGDGKDKGDKGKDSGDGKDAGETGSLGGETGSGGEDETTPPQVEPSAPTGGIGLPEIKEPTKDVKPPKGGGSVVDDIGDALGSLSETLLPDVSP